MKWKFDKRIKNGFFAANYFNKSVRIIENNKSDQTCCMQFTFFGSESIKVCGIDEVVCLIKQNIDKNKIKQINVYGCKDGEIIKPKTSVLLICGPYQYFGHLENVIDGILARRSSVCNNCYKILNVINSSQLIYMADRTDDYLLQPYDGYAAYCGGVKNFVTAASVSLIADKNVHVTGTMPHALIQQHNGNLIDALKNYIKEYGLENTVALVDYHNDIEQEIKTIALHFKTLYAIRIDTSSNIIDKGLQRIYGNKKSLYGINHQLVKLARQTLDSVGLKNTKIVVSSGLNDKKIKSLVRSKTPIDFYGVGSFLITRNIHFTADLVMLNDKPETKYGRKLFTTPNKLIKYF
jgi:nicotinate phosphoribosyltransferase